MWLLKYQEWNRWYFRVQSRENGETSIKPGPKLTKKMSGVLKKLRKLLKGGGLFLCLFVVGIFSNIVKYSKSNIFLSTNMHS